MKNILIMVPTYNEYGNIQNIIDKLISLKLNSFDILFIDDNSPDKTDAIIKRNQIVYKNIKLLTRPKKMGIGSAHLEGIAFAYKNDYKTLITLDADLTHNPLLIPKFLKRSENFDLLITTRFKNKNSLNSWPLHRKLLTLAGHITTRLLLGMKYDASGSFRIYNLKTIPYSLFSKCGSVGYSFFFESLYLININKFSIIEVPIRLNNRLRGKSKMRLKDIYIQIIQLMKLFILSKKINSI